jgi:hypothetical protein
MSKIRLVLVLLAMTVVLPVGGCIFDSDDDSGSGNYIVTGYVLDDGGRPIRDVKVRAYFDQPEAGNAVPDCSTATDSRGFYGIPFEPSVRELILFPSKNTCIFSPPWLTYVNPRGSLRDGDFTAYCGETYRIDGHVREEAGDPVGGVAMMVRDEHNVWNKTVFTDDDGYYFVENLAPDFTYVVTPARAFYRFEPAQRTYENLSQSFTNQDYVAIPE